MRSLHFDVMTRAYLSCEEIWTCRAIYALIMRPVYVARDALQLRVSHFAGTELYFSAYYLIMLYQRHTLYSTEWFDHSKC